jgi:hypothetical protein
MLSDEIQVRTAGNDTVNGELSGPAVGTAAPFVALDGSETVRHENALAVERVDGGYRVSLAVVNPGSLPLFSELFRSKFSNRAEWEKLRQARYTAPAPEQEQLGYEDQCPTPSLVASIELSGSDQRVSLCRVCLDPHVRVVQRHFGDLPPLMPPHVPDSNIDVSLVAAAQLGLALYTHRRQRGDVIFADVKHGLLLQPDGSWELFKPEDLLGRIATQEITCKVLEGVANLAAAHNIPLIYQGCAEADPTLSRTLGEQLKAGHIKSRSDIDQHLIDENSHRIRLLHRREYSSTPIPHAGLHLSAYLRMSAPLREFVDCINLQQLIRFAQGEAPLYSHEEIEGFIADEAHRQRNRVRRKGDQKYSPLVEDGLAALRINGSLSSMELRSLIADCRDAGKLPGELVEYLLYGIETNSRSMLPVLASLIFSHFIGSSRELRAAAQWIVANRSDLIDDLIRCAITSGSLSMQASATARIAAGGVAESIWCVDSRICASQRFVAKPRRFDADLELIRVQRIQFAKLCGARYGWESPNTGKSGIFPQLRRLQFELNSRGEFLALGLHARRAFGGGQTDYVLSASSDLRVPEATRYQATHSGADWLTAVEHAASEILRQLAPAPVQKESNAVGHHPYARSIDQAG